MTYQFSNMIKPLVKIPSRVEAVSHTPHLRWKFGLSDIPAMLGDPAGWIIWALYAQMIIIPNESNYHIVPWECTWLSRKYHIVPYCTIIEELYIGSIWRLIVPYCTLSSSIQIDRDINTTDFTVSWECNQWYMIWLCQQIIQLLMSGNIFLNRCSDFQSFLGWFDPCSKSNLTGIFATITCNGTWPPKVQRSYVFYSIHVFPLKKIMIPSCYLT